MVIDKDPIDEDTINTTLICAKVPSKLIYPIKAEVILEKHHDESVYEEALIRTRKETIKGDKNSEEANAYLKSIVNEGVKGTNHVDSNEQENFKEVSDVVQKVKVEKNDDEEVRKELTIPKHEEVRNDESKDS